MRHSHMVARTEEILDEAERIAQEKRDPDYFAPYHWALCQFGLTHAQRYALIFLVHYFAGFQRQHGSFYISETFITPNIPIAVGTFMNHVRELAKAGVVAMVHKALNGNTPPSQYALQYGVFAGGKRMERLMTYTPQDTPDTDISPQDAPVSDTAEALELPDPTPTPQSDAAASVCECGGVIQPSPVSSAESSPVKSSVSQQGYADLIACAAGVSGFISEDRRMMRDVLDARKSVGGRLKPLRKGSAAPPAASPAVSDTDDDKPSDLEARFRSKAQGVGLRITARHSSHIRAKFPEYESRYFNLHGVMLPLRYADYALDEAVWARARGKVKGGRGVGDMVYYASSVLRRVVEDGFTGDPGYDEDDSVAAAGDDAVVEVEAWDGAIDAEARAAWERVKDELQCELPRPAYSNWVKGSVGLWLRGDEIGVGFPSVGQAVHFAMYYAGTAPIRSGAERAVGRQLDCIAYELVRSQDRNA